MKTDSKRGGRAASLMLGGLALLAPLEASADPPSGASSDDAPVAIHRIALVVGANDGGQAREQLRYAESDAGSLATVLEEMGGVAEADRLVLSDPSPQALEEALRQVAVAAKAAQSPDTRVEFFFYYSGHSDEQGLLLQETRLPYSDLKRAIEAVPAKVRVAVLDSCASGAFTRTKGGTKRAPFMMGSSAEVEGHAYLTSSAESEAAQESDRIKGSFFTHYLVTGLRGAADENKDRLVTLSEAYQYAYDETLRRTQATQGGPQHAAYDIRLNGSGDLVLTDLRQTTARVSIAEDIAGRLYIRDKRKHLAAELYKETHSGELELALEPGTYAILLDDGRRLRRGKLTVEKGQTAVLSESALRVMSAEETRNRGDEDAVVALSHNPMRDPFAGMNIPSSASMGTDGAGSGEAADATASATDGGLGGDGGIGDLSPVPGAPPTGAPVPGSKPKLAPIDEAGYRTIPFNIGLFPGASRNRGDAPIVNNFSVSIAGVYGARLEGIAVSGGANVYGESMQGIAVAAGLNHTGGPMTGAQFAVGANVARGESQAFQLALGGNWASTKLTGMQLSGIFNYSNSLRGAQFGLINISPGRVEGAQIGLINYADDADASIGLLPISKKGGIWMDAWTSDVAAINLGMRLRARYTYVFLAGGVHPAGVNNAWLVGGGVGGRIPVKKTNGKVGIEIDLGAYGVSQGVQGGFSENETRLLMQLRAMVHWRFVKRFALFGGPSLNTFTRVFDQNVADRATDADSQTRPGYGYSVASASYGRTSLRFWPGFALGIQI